MAGAVFILGPARKRLNSNQMTILGGVALGLVYALMAVVRDPMKFLSSPGWRELPGQFLLPNYGWRDSESYQTGFGAG